MSDKRYFAKIRAAWEAAGETVSIRGTAGRIDRHIAQEGVMPHA